MTGEDRAPAGDEPGGDQQETASLLDLQSRSSRAVRPVRSACRPARTRGSNAIADGVGEIVAEERSDRSGEDHQRQRLVAGTRGDAAGDDRRLAGHDRQDRVEQCHREDDQQEPPVRRELVDPLREVADDVGDDADHADATLAASERAPPSHPTAAMSETAVSGRFAHRWGFERACDERNRRIRSVRSSRGGAQVTVMRMRVCSSVADAAITRSYSPGSISQAPVAVSQ